MRPRWQGPLTVFALFNLIGVPLIGRGAWVLMESLRVDAIMAAVAVSVGAALVILAANVLLTLRAERAGVPPVGRSLLWAVTAVTFLLPIGTGFFSPLMLIHALLTW